MEFSKNEKIAYAKGYRVDKRGNCLNSNGDILSTFENKKYIMFSIRHEGKMKKVRVHRMQAYQKFGDAIYKKGIDVRHLNGNPSDNSIDNIEIGTPSQNMMDKPKEERLRSAIFAASHLIQYDHFKVKEFYNESRSYKKTMEEFGIKSKSTLSNIVNK
jgi:hypothetical protein